MSSDNVVIDGTFPTLTPLLTQTVSITLKPVTVTAPDVNPFKNTVTINVTATVGPAPTVSLMKQLETVKTELETVKQKSTQKLDFNSSEVKNLIQKEVQEQVDALMNNAKKETKTK
jgi:hypothetical protein